MSPPVIAVSDDDGDGVGGGDGVDSGGHSGDCRDGNDVGDGRGGKGGDNSVGLVLKCKIPVTYPYYYWSNKAAHLLLVTDHPFTWA
ncbi:hypothetical protein L1987_74791 [Smallanthus sonchifolius]|uniref:Uncharacterized protein n=1 Tax=Smallanthus sonchifolius TaxID=185202 RepID=A0ACB9A370_9ASTR|nr:hypothetical protein L1987_74791 [Smallanthus sonchifolius]